MSFGSRLKELRELHSMKQQELAVALGVKNTAISNYELGISSPKEEIMFKIFEFFNVTPNYMFQDEINIKIEEYSVAEKELIRKYRELDPHGRALIDNILSMEYDHCTATDTVKLPLAARGTDTQSTVTLTKEKLNSIENNKSNLPEEL